MTSEVNEKMFSALEVERMRFYKEEKHQSQDCDSSVESVTEPSAAYTQASRAVFTLDGETQHLSATQNIFLAREPTGKHNNWFIEFLKFCAACSLSQQANDETMCYKLMKHFNRKLIYDPATNAPSWLKHIEARWITAADKKDLSCLSPQLAFNSIIGVQSSQYSGRMEVIWAIPFRSIADVNILAILGRVG
jgi:hypothetical protein